MYGVVRKFAEVSVLTLSILKKNMERSTEFTDKHVPSFFQNSSSGISATELQIPEVLEEEEDECSTRPNINIVNLNEDRQREGKAVVGGFICCVPDCFSNSRRNPELSFYNFPNGKSYSP